MSTHALAPELSAVTVDRLAELGVLSGGPTCVFVSGSRASGWTHAHSDVDVYVVAPTRPEVPGAAKLLLPLGEVVVPVSKHMVDGRHWEVRNWLDEQVDDLIAKIGADPGTGDPVALAPDEIHFCHQLTVGIAVAGASWLDARKRDLRRLGLSSILARTAARDARALIDDATGLLISGDEASAVLCARKAFGRGVDALLASTGDLSVSERWRAQRVREAAPAALPWAAYWRQETMQGCNPDEPAAWVTETVEATRRLLAAAGAG